MGPVWPSAAKREPAPDGLSALRHEQHGIGAAVMGRADRQQRLLARRRDAPTAARHNARGPRQDRLRTGPLPAGADDGKGRRNTRCIGSFAHGPTSPAPLRRKAFFVAIDACRLAPPFEVRFLALARKQVRPSIKLLGFEFTSQASRWCGPPIDGSARRCAHQAPTPERWVLLCRAG